MNQERRIGLGLALAGAALLALTLPTMSRRLRAHNERASFQRYAFQQINDERFEFMGEPGSVRLVNAEGASGGAQGVEIAWRGETLRIASSGRSEARLPGLLKVDDWLKVLQMRELERGEAGVAPRDSGTRIIVVARRPASGADDAKYVDRKGWVYDLVELRRSGASEAPAPLPSPGTERGGGRKERAPLVNEFNQTEAFARWTVNFAALPEYERTWQYAAALAVTPRLSYPRNKFTDDGLAAMGWTWPAAGVGVLGVVCGAVILGASTVRRERLGARFRAPIGA